MLRKKPVKSVKRKSKVSNPIKKKRKNPIKRNLTKLPNLINDQYYIIVFDYDNKLNINKPWLLKARYDIIKWNSKEQKEFITGGDILISNAEVIEINNIHEIHGPFNSKQDVKEYLASY